MKTPALTAEARQLSLDSGQPTARLHISYPKGRRLGGAGSVSVSNCVSRQAALDMTDLASIGHSEGTVHLARFVAAAEQGVLPSVGQLQAAREYLEALQRKGVQLQMPPVAPAVRSVGPREPSMRRCRLCPSAARRWPELHQKHGAATLLAASCREQEGGRTIAGPLYREDTLEYVGGTLAVVLL